MSVSMQALKRLLLTAVIISFSIVPSGATISKFSTLQMLQSSDIYNYVAFTQTPEDLLIAVGSEAQFTCLFTSTNTASVQWQRDGTAVIPSSRITITTSTLTIDPTQSSDEGQYSCIVTDQVTQVSQTRNANLVFACKTIMLTILNSIISRYIGLLSYKP